MENIENTESTETTKHEGLRIYEVGFLVSSAIPEDKIPEIFESIKKTDSIASGSVISEEAPKMRPLAYQMIKSENGKNTRFQNAYFGSVKFETTADSVATLKKFMEEKPEIIRFLIVKTVRENTMSNARTFATRSRIIKPTTTWTPGAPAETAPATPISSEDLDKTIEELVIN